MTEKLSAREWLDAATGGTIDQERLVKYADAHVYIARRLLRLWDAPVESAAPADVFTAEWPVEEETA
jgi:hypothetical protein